VNNTITVGADRHIINRGVDPARISAVTRAPVRQVSVRDLQTRQHWLRTGGYGAERFSSPSGIPGAYSGNRGEVAPGHALPHYPPNSQQWTPRPSYPNSAPIAPSAPSAPSANQPRRTSMNALPPQSFAPYYQASQPGRATTLAPPATGPSSSTPSSGSPGSSRRGG
jgi:hypothetical protein